MTPEQITLLDSIYAKLVAQIREYRPTASLTMVEEAYTLAREAHSGQFRKSGEPYMTHPLEVAIILAEIRADLESIIAALLHDVVEDTHVTEEELTEQFGTDVSLLVAGVTKIKKVKYVTITDAKAENYRKMFFHMSEDVRVLLIKIADRLHNMRTIEAKSEEKQRATAQETLDIYAPLAHRLGVAKLRYELEDLSFKYSDRAIYNTLSKQVKLKLPERIELTEQLITEIRTALHAQGIKATVEGRPKRLYSVYKKMKQKNYTLDQINDLYAVRILVEDVAACYAALGCVNGLFTPVEGRIKDYIGKRKPNGYQSLHTTLMGPGEHFEVQIRSYMMHEVAEFGVAAHWKYKEGNSQAAKDKWLQEIMALQHEISDSDEFLSALKMDLSAFQGHISCFTPKGEPINLVEGATAVDFAYAIHSAVGNRMAGARVNNKLVPISHVLAAGDIVEIVTSQNSKPNRDWLQFVKTNQARTKINQWFNRENREENVQKGREALERVANELKVPLDELLAEGREKDVLARFNCKNMEQLYAMVGGGGVKEKQVVNHLYREYEKVQPPPSDEELIQSLLETKSKNTNKGTQSGVVVKGVGDTGVLFSKCCTPVPGDEILGFVTRGRGMTVHRTDCINVLNMNELERRRIINNVQWDAPVTARRTYRVNLKLICPDRDNLLYSVNEVLKDESVRVYAISANVEESNATFSIGIEIHDTEHLNHVTNRLKSVTGAYEIRRIHS